ncbi:MULTISPECIES: hypothetical protein [unclassified Microcoleus]|uniref:hypothetical protein n=1 Tax=unclassified Microcoleus TaxID=2642155 RepID=UPI002FD3FD3A
MLVLIVAIDRPRNSAYRLWGRSRHYAQKPGFLAGLPAATPVLLCKTPVSLHPRLGSGKLLCI